MDEAALQDATAVRVAVRVRPLITREVLQGSRPCISTDGPCVTVGRDRRFTFDHAFGPNTQQEQVYQEVVSPLVESCFDGFNVTVLAYGQTGSGKTFTMGTGECKDEEQLGIAPRVIRHVFQGIEARKHQAAFYVRAQFLEIYNEDVKDLLLPPTEQAVKWVSREQAQGAVSGSSGAGGITLRHAGDGTIMVIGASEEPAECAEDLAELLERGLALRATSSTCANEQSSRSHAILTIIIEQHVLVSCSGEANNGSPGNSGGGAGSDGQSSTGGSTTAAGEVRTAKLHLVDLAGSERTKQLRSSMQGTRFRETVNINQGLLALGNVISALGDERRRGSHVPYRESKLTRLLQDSLGGNSRTAMIACVSPADEVLEETLNTLKYANRAKNIRNKPIVNRSLPSTTLSPLVAVVLDMQLQVLQQLVAQLPDGSQLAQGLPPLTELMALDSSADPSGCLEVLTRMKSALALAGASTGTPTAGRKGSGEARGGQATGGGAACGGDGDEVVSGCSRAIAGILHGLAEMEAAGHVNKEARAHILRALDASTLRLLPAVRSMAPRSAAGAQVEPTTSAPASTSGPATQQPTEAGDCASPGTQDTVRLREKALEAQIRELEVELQSCRSELQAAKEDLDRDEVIFADKMKELEDARAASDELRQRLGEAEERRAKEVEELRKQIATLSTSDTRDRSPGPSRVNSLRGRTRPAAAAGPGAGSGLARQHSLSETTVGTKPAADAEAASPPADAEAEAQDGSDGDERGAEEDEVLYDEELLSYISETDYTEQHRREVLESDAALREELAEVLREKAAAEAERAAIERAALAQRSSFDRAKAVLEQQLSWLSSNIAKQQEQLTTAQAAEREAKELAAKWEERARELESAIEAREEALQRLRSELDAVEGNVQRSAEERAALRQQYEQRIATVVAQVNSLQRQLQQHTSSAGGDKRERLHSAERMAASEAELARLRSQQADLRKQLSERVARYERESAARLKELAALRKAASAARSRMQALEQENRAQRVLLREKQQEVLAAEQRLRDSQRSSATPGAAAPRSRSSSPGNRGYMGRTSTASAAASTDAAPHSASFSRGSSLRGGVQQQPNGNNSVARACRSTGGGAMRRQSVSPGRMPTRPPGPPGRSMGNDARATSSSQQQQSEDIAEDSSGGAQRQGQEQPSQGRKALSTEQQQELRDWAEQLMSLVADVAGVEARLEVLSSRHRELLGRREQLHRDRAHFGLRTQRRAEQLSQAIAACEAQLANLMGRIPSPRFDTPPASQSCTPRTDIDTSGGGAVPGAGAGGGGSGGGARQARGAAGGGGFGGSHGLLSDEWVALQQRIADVSHAKATLEQRLKTGRLLEEREQQIIDSLDDQMDDLETQLTYILDELTERRCALALLQRRRDALQQRATDLDPGGLRVALSTATEAVGHRTYQVRQLEAALAASEAGAARREAQLQVRLRESLVSLSAHLATLEATSPGSSASLNSSELRNLLGIYLDLNSGLGSGLLGGVQAATASGPLAPAPTVPVGGPAGVAPASRHLSPGAVLADTAANLLRSTPAAYGASVGDTPARPGAGDAPPWSTGLGAKASAAAAANVPPAPKAQADLGLQGLPNKAGSTAKAKALISAELRTLSSGGQGKRPAGALGHDEMLACEAGGNGGSSSGSGAETPVVLPDEDDGAEPEESQLALALALGHPSAPGLHRRTGSAGPGGGILRRTGSMESVGSTSSVGYVKRVTWVDSAVSGIALSSGDGSVPGTAAGAAHGSSTASASSRVVKERSILDRPTSAKLAHVARVACRANGEGGRGGGGGGPAGMVGDASRLLRDARARGQGWWEEQGARWRSGSAGGANGPNSSGGGGVGGGNDGVAGFARGVLCCGDKEDGGAPDAALERFPPKHSSFSIASAVMDDTAPGMDAGAATTAAGSGCEGDGNDEGGGVQSVEDHADVRSSLRSFNPWGAAASDSVKRRRSAWETQQQQRQGQMLLLEGQGLDLVLDSSGDIGEGGEDDEREDAALQDPRGVPLRCQEGGDSRISLEAADAAAVHRSGPPPSDWQQTSSERESDRFPRQQLQADLPPGSRSGPGLRPARDEYGRYCNHSGTNTSHNSTDNGTADDLAVEWSGILPGQPGFEAGDRQKPAAAGYDNSLSRLRDPKPLSSNRNGNGMDTDDDEELEGHVRLLAQAAAAARLADPAETPRLLIPALSPSATGSQEPGSSHGHPGGGPGCMRDLQQGYGGEQQEEDEAVVVTVRSRLEDGEEEEEDVGDVLPRSVLLAASTPTPPAWRRLESGSSAFGVSTAWATGTAADGGARSLLPRSAPIPSQPPPPPLQEPARSVSPIQPGRHHQRQQQHHNNNNHEQQQQEHHPQHPKPGPFTSPAPMALGTPLWEALMPYKAHLKRSGGGQGSGASAGGGGTGGAVALAHRAGTPEGRRLVALNSAKVGFNSPLQQLQHQHQQQRSVLPTGVWLPSSGDTKSGAAAGQQQQVRQQYMQQQQQQPWRPGPVSEAGARGFSAFADEDRPSVGPRSNARPRAFMS